MTTESRCLSSVMAGLGPPKQKDRLAAVFPEFSLLRSRSECCRFLLLPAPAEQAESTEAGAE
jgi:hypothetical protein